MHVAVRWLGSATLALTIASASSVPSASAQTSAQATTQPGPAVGSIAPDFSLPGATRYGLLKGPVRLADFRGETVVLAFFYQARSKG